MYHDWLRANAPGYAVLPVADQEVLAGFLFLWSLFEAKTLGEQGNPDAICAAAERWRDRAPLDAEGMTRALRYFRDRYFAEGGPTAHFHDLRFRSGGHRDLVEAVLAGARDDPVEQAAAVLLIVYRLRNNLFHGVKWQYGLAGQRDNFEHANHALMAALTVNGL